MRDDYSDIIDLPHHVSAKHPPMAPEQRAAQFSPFAALVGHEAAIRETARLTQDAPDLSPDELARLDAALSALVAQDLPVRVTRFVPDARKQGGSYAVSSGRVVRLDSSARTLALSDGSVFPLSSVVSVEPVS